MAKIAKKEVYKELDEYAKLCKKHRKSTKRHVLVVEAAMPEDDKRRLFHLANLLRIVSNNTTGAVKKNLEQMQRTKVYKETKHTYGMLADKLSKLQNTESDEYQAVKAERDSAAGLLNYLQKQFNVTFEFVRKFAEEQAKIYHIHSVFALTCAEDVWTGVERVLYGNGKTLHFKKRGDLPSIRAKQVNRGIVVKAENEKLTFSVKGVTPFGVIIKKGDVFAETEIANMISFLMDTNAEKRFIELYQKTKTPQNTYRICFCTLCCEPIRNKLRVFVHITVEGEPVAKLNKNGEPRHNFGKGVVGTDIGTQSIAVVSDHGLTLDNLAERDNKSTKKTERTERLLQRKLDRSRRATNPERFNEDGTYKKIRGKWKKSRNYRRSEKQLKNIRRKNTESRKYAIQEMANDIRELGDVLITEPSNAKALQKKAKPAKFSKNDTNKNKRRKRFGKSILHRCPGAMHATLKAKFESTGGHFYEVDKMYRASQYDHKADLYTKKKLSQRWHKFDDGTKAQRDLYSAFLMYCANSTLTAPNRDLCHLNFNSFLDKQSKLIDNIQTTHKNICNSGIKVAA